MQGLKDIELQKYYEDRFVMLASPGWADFLSEVEKQRGFLSDIRRLRGETDLAHAKGQLDVLDWAAGLKDTTEAAYHYLLEQDEAE